MRPYGSANIMIKKPLLLFLAVGMIASANAAVVSINFVGAARGTTESRSLLAGDTAGAYSAVNWNNVSSSGAALLDSAGGSSSITVTTSGGLPGGWGSDIITGTSGGEKLYKGYLDIAGSLTTLTLSGLVASETYQVYVYSNGENNNSGTAQTRTGTFTLGGVTTSITDGRADNVENTFDGTYNLVPAGSSAQGNYTVFTITGSTSYNLTAQGTFAEAGRGGDDTFRAPLNGIQIVSIPEASTSLLGCCAGALMLLRRKRR